MLPGILTAITGVGVGDLATAGFAGAHLGVTVLWAVVIGALFKFVLSEGVARWQISTGTTVLHGAITHLRWPFIVFFVLYFFPWCWFVAGALINAAGVAGSHLAEIAGFEVSKAVSGISHSLLALLIILVGKHRAFNTVMSILAVVLFVFVMVCVFFVAPPLSELIDGLFIISIPENLQPLSWVVALIGGVGGTLTIVCYGYWIADSGREGVKGLKQCRIDLSVSYLLTALFGLAMVIIGSAVAQQGKGLNLLLDISNYFSSSVHPALGVIFLVGAWAAIFSSLLGVWQVIPQVFADCVYALKHRDVSPEAVDQSRMYYIWLLVMALVPMLSLDLSFKDVQKLYSVVGALFVPVLAMALLWLNRERFVSNTFMNSKLTNIALMIVLFFFSYVGYGVFNKI